MIWLLLIAQALFFMGLGVILLILWESYRGNEAEFESVRRFDNFQASRRSREARPRERVIVYPESKNPFQGH